jgi:putative chitinase
MHVIDLIDAQLLKIACPENSVAVLATWADPIKAGCRGSASTRCARLRRCSPRRATKAAVSPAVEENLNYSAQRLAEVWPGRYSEAPWAPPHRPNKVALRLAHNPEAIANHVYANRMGNGPPESGDGWRHRGFGPFQLTGKRNQAAFGAAVGVPIEQVPDFLRTLQGGALSMCWFFKVNGLEDLAATPGVADETKRINGGTSRAGRSQAAVRRRRQRIAAKGRVTWTK